MFLCLGYPVILWQLSSVITNISSVLRAHFFTCSYSNFILLLCVSGIEIMMMIMIWAARISTGLVSLLWYYTAVPACSAPLLQRLLFLA